MVGSALTGLIRPADAAFLVNRSKGRIELRTLPGRVGQEVGDRGEAGEVEVADGDVHAVGVGVGEDGAEVGGEVRVAVGVEDGHSGLPRQVSA